LVLHPRRRRGREEGGDDVTKIYITCDICNPHTWTYGTNLGVICADRARARQLGWRRFRKYDVCPACVRKRKGGA